jgi:hypothetical protein
MRFMCANRISIFLRSGQDCWKASDVANCLRDAGYVVIETASGEEAIAAL